MKGMVIIDSNHYGKSMEIAECIKDKIVELVESLSYAEMGERSYNKYEDKEDYEDYEDYIKKHSFGMRGGMGGRRMPKGRFNY